MDPIGALIIAALVFGGGVSGWFGDQKSRFFGDGSRPHHERRMQERAQQHERRMQADKLRHEARMAGKAGPTIQESVAERVRRGRKPYTEMGPIRRWWYDLCADRVEQLTRERRERERRRANGEQEWQKFGRWFRARWEQAKDRAERRWQERHATQDPDGRPWVDSERDDDWPDPNIPDPGVVDAEVVDDPRPTKPEEPRQLEPPFPDWTPPPGQGDTTPPPADGDSDRAGWVGRGPTQPNPTPQQIPEAERAEEKLPVEDTSDDYMDNDTYDRLRPASWSGTEDGGMYGPFTRDWVRAGADEFYRKEVARLRATDDRAELASAQPHEGAAVTQPVPIQGGAVVGMSETSADMTAANATAFSGTASQILQMMVQAYTEAVADLIANKKVSGPALAAFQAAESDLESALLNTQQGGRVTAEHEAKADEYRDYQAVSGSGDAKTYAELN